MFGLRWLCGFYFYQAEVICAIHALAKFISDGDLYSSADNCCLLVLILLPVSKLQSSSNFFKFLWFFVRKIVLSYITLAEIASKWNGIIMANCVALIYCCFMHIHATVQKDTNNYLFLKIVFLLKIRHWG